MTPVSRRTLLLTGVLLVLGFARFAVGITGDRPAVSVASPLAGFDPGAATSIALRRGEQRLSLARKDGIWRMAEPDDLADPLMAERLLNQLRDLRVVRIAAEDTRDLAAFGLADDRALRIAVRAGDAPLADIRVASEGGRSYLLRDGTTRIVEVEGAFPEQATPDAWRSRSVLTVEPSAVREVELRGAKESVLLRRAGEAFELQRGTEVRAVSRAKGETFLAQLANLRATGFLEPAKAPGLDAPVLTVTVRAQDRPDAVLKIGAATETGDRAASVSGRSAPFALSALDVRALEEPDFAAEAPSSSAQSSPAS